MKNGVRLRRQALLCAAVAVGVAFLGVPNTALAKKKAAGTEGLDVECTGKKKSKRASGTLSSISPMQRTVTVTVESEKRTFRVASNCTISTPEKAKATLMDIKLGLPVQVSYFRNEFKTEVACTITQTKAAAAGKSN